MVLPSGLKATLETMPSFTASGWSTRRWRPAASHSTTPPPLTAKTPYPAAMVLPSGLKATLETKLPSLMCKNDDESRSFLKGLVKAVACLEGVLGLESCDRQ